MAYVDATFLREVAERLAEGPSPSLLDPSTVEVLDVALDRVDHPPAAVVHYLHDGEEDVFRFELDDATWSFGDAEEAAQLVWVELAESLHPGD